jgi:hypothetical protein
MAMGAAAVFICVNGCQIILLSRSDKLDIYKF